MAIVHDENPVVVDAKTVTGPVEPFVQVVGLRIHYYKETLATITKTLNS